MKIVVTIATIDPQQGGPARTVPALCRALARAGGTVEIVTIAEHGREIAALIDSNSVTTVISSNADRYHPRSWARQFKDALRKAIRAKDAIIYDVGLWLPSNHFAAQVATSTGTPRIASPRGMLSDQALKVSNWKKKFAWAIYQCRDLKRAGVLHATSEKEAEEFRALKLRQPIAIVPNGVEMPEGFRERRTQDRGQKTLLFLSRLHPMKGLKDLVTAWARIRPNGWRVVIAGPSENNHQQEMESLADSLGVRRDFEFIGSVDDDQKWKLLSQTDLFVLPSYSESFGMAIAEALAAGVPVITTRATPWREIETYQCGWWVDVGADSIAEALSSAISCSREELRAKGLRGRELVVNNYSWDSAAKKLLPVFEWTLGRADKPACIV
jgi:glycosyltransferase involved in cell wall biosynthesis